jgi:plasmid stabilization system protein ParE
VASEYKKLIVSEDAARGLESIFFYIAPEFGEKRAKIYKKELLDHLRFIQKNPLLFPFFDKENDMRHTYFQSLTVILYEVRKDSIYINAIKDVRSNWKEEA